MPFPQYREDNKKGKPRRASSPSLVLNFGLRISSPESFPFFPAKVALGQPDKLEAEVIHHWPVRDIVHRQVQDLISGLHHSIPSYSDDSEASYSCFPMVTLLHFSFPSWWARLHSMKGAQAFSEPSLLGTVMAAHRSQRTQALMPPGLIPLGRGLKPACPTCWHSEALNSERGPQS